MTKGTKEFVYAGLIFLLIIALLASLFLRFPDTSITGAIHVDEIMLREEISVPESVTREDALDLLMKSEEDLDEMESFDLHTYFIQDTLLNAKRYFIGEDTILLERDVRETTYSPKKKYFEHLLEVARGTPAYEIKKRDYKEVAVLTQLIELRKKQAYEIFDTIALLEEREQALSERDIDTSVALQFISRGKKAFKEERYTEAIEHLEEAEKTLVSLGSEYQRAKEIVRLSKNFFLRYWWQTILVLVLVGVISAPTARYINKGMAKRKMNSLNLELDSLQKALKKAQEDRFVNKTITAETYKLREKRYKERMTQIKHTLPVLDAVAYGKKGKEAPEKEDEEKKARKSALKVN